MGVTLLVILENQRDLVFMKKFLAFILIVQFIAACSKSSDSFTVEKKNLIESVYSSIIVEPAHKYLIQAGANGYIDLIAYEEGDTITPEDILFKLRDESTFLTAENAQLSYNLAESYYRGELNQLEDLELEMQTARTKYETDSLNFNRIKILRSKGVSSEQEFETYKLQLENSRNQWSIVQNRKKRLQKELQTKMKQARNTASNSSSKLNDLFVHSQISGMIYQLFKEEGEYVTIKEPLAIVGTKDDFVIQMRIDEVDIMRIRNGQRVVITLESYPGKSFEAIVTRLLPKLEDQTQTFVIEAKFTKAPEQLYYGLSGEGNIVVNQRENVIIVPLEYLNENDEVLTRNGLKKLKLGLKNLSEAEVIEGLKEGEVIYKPEE